MESVTYNQEVSAIVCCNSGGGGGDVRRSWVLSRQRRDGRRARLGFLPNTEFARVPSLRAFAHVPPLEGPWFVCRIATSV